MDSIFHEKQEGSLCAQHCLNALLQEPYFTAVDLATLAQRMDEEERKRMAESGEDTEDYRRFREQPSENMDDSGYFSVQVICSALEFCGLDLVPFKSSGPLTKQANLHPETMSAYICNYRDHWFTIRKLGFQWFNLNSLLSKPELISDTYLTLLLAQLQQEGYSIFLVRGDLPECKADELLKINPAVPIPKTPLKKEVPKSEEEIELNNAMKLSLGEPVDKDEEDYQAALRLSLQEEKDPSLDRAIKLSLQLNSTDQNEAEPGPSKGRTSRLDHASGYRLGRGEGEDGKQLGGEESQPNVVNIPISVEGRETSNQTSLNNTSATGTPLDIEEIRRKRLALLDSRAATER